MTSDDAKTALRRYASAPKARILSGFFKTGPGEYGEGDVFIGVKVPEIRKVAEKFAGLPLDPTLDLLRSKIHEERLLALLILIRKYDKGNASLQKEIVRLYLNNTRHINNWDLVDLSAPKILGHWLLAQNTVDISPRKERDSASAVRPPADAKTPSDEGKGLLRQLAGSPNLWERRIAVVSTFTFIRNRNFSNTLSIADMLMDDPEDLIHKAVGWMLREVGKQDIKVLQTFLRPRCRKMPRTMLRYAIEKFPGTERLAYMKGEV